MSENSIPAPPPIPGEVSAEDAAAIEAALAQDATPKRKAPKPPAAKKQAEPEAKASNTGNFQSKVIPMYHPYQKATVPVVGSVLLERDSWVEVQVNAGVIFEVK